MQFAFLVFCLIAKGIPINPQSSAIDCHSCSSLKPAKTPFILVLNQGDSLIESILQCANSTELKSASISGVGALKDPMIAYYNLETKQYETQKFEGIYELAALDGNITFVEGKRTAHIHVVLGDRKHQAFAGHLIEGTVGITAEITIIPLEYPIHRKMNPRLGINLIDPQ